MRAIVKDINRAADTSDVFIATISIIEPETDEIDVECKYRPADPSNPMDLPFFAISDASKIHIQTKGYTVRSIQLVLKPAVITYAEG